MCAWNVLSLREDDHLSLLSSELKRLDIGIAALIKIQNSHDYKKNKALSGVRRPDLW